MHALLHTGSDVYYGWSVGAVLPLLPLMAGLAGKKLACALVTSKHVVIGLFAMTCAVTCISGKSAIQLRMLHHASSSSTTLQPEHSG